MSPNIILLAVELAFLVVALWVIVEWKDHR